jgi:hypothetical protein
MRRDRNDADMAQFDCGDKLDNGEYCCAPFPGPFLYYPSRCRPSAAFAAFVAEWR